MKRRINRTRLKFLLGISLLGMLGVISMNVFASGIDGDLNSFFKGLGYSSNVTSPGAYHGQQAGYYTGGSLFERNTVRDFQLASVDLPSWSGGCGGIDLFSGGFSFINSKQLEAALKNVANNAVNYAFMLALKTVSPLIANTTEDLQSWANKVNNMNINSCETGAALVGSIWPKTDEAQRNVCASIGTQGGIFDDWAAARQGCGSGGQRDSVLNKGLNEKGYKDMVFENTNIAWQAIMKNGFLSSNQSLAELFMSLSGSIIVKHADGSNHAADLPSLASDRNLLNALLHGGSANIYHCDTSSKCLNPEKRQVTISKDDALETQVHALLQDMLQHVYDNTPLTKPEIGLLQATPLPVYKMLSVNAAYVGDPEILNITEYSDIIAASILFQYINENLDVVRESTSVLQYPNEVLNKFMKDIDAARSRVQSLKENNYKRINQTYLLIQRTQLLEQQLIGRLSSHLGDNVRWANNMR